MKKMNYLYMILMFSAMFVSCNKKADRLLEKIENIVEQQPDSALKMLNSVTEPYSVFSQKQYAIYKLLKIRAKDLTGEDIYNDIDGLSSSAYCFKPNSRYMALTELYFGKIYQLQENNDKALKSFLKAATISEKLDDDNLKGLIYYFLGDSYYKQHLYDDAISKLKLSLEHFSKQDNYKQKIAVFNLIGNCFLMKSEKNSSMIDSAMMNSAISHYNQALELAETNEDLKQQAIVKQNLSEAYLKYNQPEMAKQQLIQALELNADLRDKIYLSLATVYGKEKLIDSAVYFAGLSLELFHEKNDTAALYTNYRLLSRLERQNGNYKKALEYYQKSDKCRTSILNKTGKYNLPEKEQQYTIDLLKNKNNTLFIRIILAAITILVLFCAIFALCVYFNRKIKRIKDSADAKEVILAKTQNDLEDARAKLSETNELLLESKSENVEIKVILANTQSEASETKTALLNQLETQEKSFSELQVTHKLTLNENEKLQKSFAENEQKWHNESVQVTELKQLLHEETNCKKQITKFYKMIFELEENPSQTISIKELSSKIFVTGKWETIYMLHRTLFDEIKQNFKVFDKNDKNKKTVEEYFQILCLICIDYSNTTIAYIVISTANTIQMKKGDIARLLGINAPKFIKSHVLQILNNRFE